MKRPLTRGAYGTIAFFLCFVSLYGFISLCFYLSGLTLVVAGVCLLACFGLGILAFFKGKKAPSAPAVSQKEMTKRIAITAVLLALVAICKLFSFNVPIFGSSGMNVGLGGIFTAFPAMLFGPVFGGVASACSDLLGCLIKPTGAYNPLFTLAAFVGGFIKGAVWLLIKNVSQNKLRAVAVFAASALLVLGVGTHISLYNDGIISSFVTTQASLPSKGQVENTDKSLLSSLAVSLAKYNIDTYTLSSVNDTTAESFAVPAAMICDGETYSMRIGPKAFTNCTALKSIYIPASVKVIDKEAFSGLTDTVVIYCEKDSAADKRAKSLSLAVCYDVMPEPATLSSEYGGTTYDYGTFTVTAKQQNSRYMAGYINFLTVGVELAAVLIFVFVLLELAFSKRNKTVGREPCGFKIFMSVFTAGFVVTTINTEILRYIVYPSWSSRAFFIIWIPRVAEELIICALQAYFITLLYDVYKTRILKSRHV